MRSLAVVAVGLALGIGVAVAVIARSGADDGAAKPAASQPQAAEARRENRRVLTAEQTKRLVRYASALHACLRSRGINVAAPAKEPRAIAIETEKAVGLERLVGLVTGCAGRLGDPPSPSSLQAVDARTIALSVPKQCLLDPKVELAR